MATTVQSYGNFVDGQWVPGGNEREVFHKYTGEILAVVQEANRQTVGHAVTAACRASEYGPLVPTQRFEVLSQVAKQIEDHKEVLALETARESGFTFKDCLNDVKRAVQTVFNVGRRGQTYHGRDGARAGRT